MTEGIESCASSARAAVLTGRCSRAPVARALEDYLAGRTTGPVFITKTGKRMGAARLTLSCRQIADGA